MSAHPVLPETGRSGEADLDPDDWDAFRALAHRMLDDALDDLQTVADGPVWQPMPPDIRSAWAETLPKGPTPATAVYALYRRLIAPFATGNRHPAFFGWVHGGGTPLGMLAEMLAGSLNANLGGRDHSAILCERQVIRWAAEMLGFPPDASGILVTGTSIANFMAVHVARTAALGAGSRASGIGAVRLTAYAAGSVHNCVGRALDMAGIGSDGLRLVPTDPDGGIDLAALAAAVARDRRAGCQPFLIVGTAGSVDTGAIDNLTGLADFAQSEGLWFHVDAAFGAIAMLSPLYRPLLRGIERAGSVAFDFHKWAQVPYDAGCLMVRDAEAHRAAFAQDAAYLARSVRGLAAGAPWPCDLGPDLSRGFRALKVWMTLKTFGTRRLGRVVEQSCRVARHLGQRVGQHADLELVAPVRLNIVCFAVVGLDDRAHGALAADLQESGIAAPSTTRLAGRVVLRAAIVNHRSRACNADRLIAAVRAMADRYRTPRALPSADAA